MRFRFGECEFDLPKRELIRSGRPVDIESKVLDVLGHLLLHRDRVVPKNELLDTVWPDVAVVESVLTRAVSLARDAIGDPRGTAPLIRTFRGLGYRFVAPVALLEESEAPQPPDAPLIARDGALDTLTSAWDRARRGPGSCLLLSGEAGIGKSRLSEALVDRVATLGGRTFVARNHESDATPPFWTWIQILRALQEQDALDGLGLRHESDRDLLGVLLPGVSPLGAAGRLNDEASERFRLFDLLSRGLANLGRSEPTLVVFDDLHWADHSSLRALAMGIPALAESRVLVVGCFREDEVEHNAPLSELLDQAARQRVAPFLRLQPFDREAVADYVAHANGGAAPAEWIGPLTARSAGNPLFLKLLVAETLETDRGGDTGTEALPPEIRSVILTRTSRASEPCRAVLRAAALIGAQFSADLAARVSRTDPASCAAALKEAVARGLLDTDACGAFHFAHPLIEQALRTDLSRDVRADAHHAAVEALVDAGLGPVESAAAIAHHAFEAARAGGDATTARIWASRAAESDLRQFAHDEAAAHYGRALEALGLERRTLDSEEGRLTLARGRALGLLGDGAAARTTLFEAASMARRSREPVILAESAIELGQQFPLQPGVIDPERESLIEEALAGLGDGHPALRSALHAQLSLARFVVSPPSAAVDAAAVAVELAEGVDDDFALAQALAAQVVVTDTPDSTRDDLALTDRLVHHASRCRNAALHGLALCSRAQMRFRHDDAEGGRRDVDAQIALGDATRNPVVTSLGLTMRGMLALVEGNASEAERIAQEALALGQQSNSSNAIQGFGALILMIRLEQGRGEETVPLLQQLSDEHPSLGPWRAAIARAHAESGEHGDAARILRELHARDFEGLDMRFFWPGGLGSAALACTGEEPRACVDALYQWLAPHHARCVTSVLGTHGPYDLFLGRLARLAGRTEIARRHLQRSIARCDRMQLLLFSGRSRCEMARLLLESGQPAEREQARRLADDVAASVATLDLPALTDDAHAVLEEAARCET